MDRPFSLQDQADAVDDGQMDGVVHIEKVFHPPFAPLTVVESQEGEGCQGEPLGEPEEGEGQQDQTDGGEQKLFPPVPAQVDEHRQQHAPKAVVDGKVCVVQQLGQAHAHEDHARPHQVRAVWWDSSCLARSIDWMRRIDSTKVTRIHWYREPMAKK